MEKHKYILITGTSSGIGYDAVRYLLDKGYNIIATVRNQEDKKRLEDRFDNRLEVHIVDLCNDEDIDHLVNHLKEKLSSLGLSGLVNNAGIAMGGPLMHVSKEEFELQMNTNLYSIFKLTNALLPLMGAGQNSVYDPATIVNISSVSGLINTPMLGPYCISKHALESMSDIYRRELAVYGIRVVLLEPGPIKTPIWDKSVPASNPYIETDFKNIYDQFKKEVGKSEENALPVAKVSAYIYKALTSSKTANRYIIAKNKLMIKIISALVPDKVMDWIFIAQLKKHMNKESKVK